VTKYSICMTCFNEAGTVRGSLNSLLNQLNDDYEIVVVDNYSRDGTYEVLREFERTHGVKVVQKRCSRGLGRQVALENSSGEYIIANMDLDDIFLPVVDRAMAKYHEMAEGKLIVYFNFPNGPTEDWVQNITVGPRSLVLSLGGWRDLNVFEDWDIWSRANRANRYGWCSFRFAANETIHAESRNAYSRLTSRYDRYRSRLRLGMRIFSPGERIGVSQRLAYIWARLSVLQLGVLEGQDLSFNPIDVSHYVDLFPPSGESAPLPTGAP
jgi:glycosyltransferase involved in cell wall biosynthesis